MTLGISGVRLRGQEVCIADSVSFSACQGQSQQVDYRAGIGTQSCSDNSKQVRPSVVRLLVHAGEVDIAAVVAKMQVIGQARYDTALFMPPEVLSKPWAWTPQNLRNQNNTRSNPAFTRNRSQTDNFMARSS